MQQPSLLTFWIDLTRHTLLFAEPLWTSAAVSTNGQIQIEFGLLHRSASKCTAVDAVQRRA